MKTLLLSLFVALSLVSCNIGPTVRMADGSLLTTGGSFLSESVADARSVAGPNGIKLNWVVKGKNETGVAKAGLAAYTTVGGLKEVGKAVASREATKQVVAKEGTKQVGLTEATKQLGITTTAKTTTTETAIGAGAPVTPVTVNAP